MNLIFIILLAFVPVAVHAGSPIIKVAVLDTGLNWDPNIPVCDNITYGFPGPDKILHGSNVASLITREAGKASFCLVPINIYKGSGINTQMYLNALQFVLLRGDISIINLSLAGFGYLPTESKLIKALLDRKVLIVAAAGNNSQDLGKNCNVYPACTDPRVIVVGNEGAKSSNFGTPVDIFENGVKQAGGGITFTGTSQAAAIFTGNVIRLASERLHGK